MNEIQNDLLNAKRHMDEAHKLILSADQPDDEAVTARITSGIKCLIKAHLKRLSVEETAENTTIQSLICDPMHCYLLNAILDEGRNSWGHAVANKVPIPNRYLQPYSKLEFGKYLNDIANADRLFDKKLPHDFDLNSLNMQAICIVRDLACSIGRNPEHLRHYELGLDKH